MAKTIDVKSYCTAIVDKFHSVKIDKHQNLSVDFEDLFFYVKIADGSMAVSNYSEVMEYAASASTGKEDPVQAQLAQLSSALLMLERENASADPDDEETGVASSGGGVRVVTADRGSEDDYNEKISKIAIDHIKVRLAGIDGEGKGIEARKKVFSFKEEDPEYAKFLILPDVADMSRTLLLAPAGHGKTTLLRRVMLYYAGHFVKEYNKKKKINSLNTTLRQRYFLPKDRYVPFFVRLRDSNDADAEYDIVQLMKKSMELFAPTEAYMSPVDSFGEHTNVAEYVAMLNRQREYYEKIDEFVNSVLSFDESKPSGGSYDNILLLIDGLDELSDKNKTGFLNALQEFVEKYPKIRYILSTRVAGIKDESVKESFAQMDFHCRSILPFTSVETRAYSENWINITQPEDTREKYLSRLNQLLTNRKFAYLRNSMRGPLDHVIILRQLVASSLSMSRYLVFRDMLREYFTRHEDQQRKEAVFEDSMNLLSFIAYDMQRRDSLFVSRQNVTDASDELRDINFHTGIISKDRITDTVFDFMARLAANTGLMESYKSGDEFDLEEREKYTFPIRAYQEFLCAYACCHLRLEKSSGVPDPVKIISANIDDKKWNDVVSFSLSDLKNGIGTQTQYTGLVDVILNSLDSSPEQKNFLLSLLETEMVISGNQATLICEKYLTGISLTTEQRAILDACMEYESGSAMLLSLLGKCRVAAEEGREDFFEAAARAHVLWSLKRNESFIVQARKLLTAPSFHKNKIGAMMFVIVSEMAYEEQELRFERLLTDVTFSEDIVKIVYGCYKKEEQLKDITFIEALSAIRFCGNDEGGRLATDILTENHLEFFDRLSCELKKSEFDMFALSLHRSDMVEKNYFPWARRIVYTMGTYPAIRKLWNHPAIQFSGLVAEFMKSMYNSLVDIGKCDIFATVFARLNYSITVDEFLGIISRYVSKSSDGDWLPVGKDSFNARTVRTMELLLGDYIRKGIFDSDKVFEQVIAEVVGLIGDGEFEEAAERCEEYAETIGNHRLASKLKLCKAYVHIARREKVTKDTQAYDREIEAILEMESGNRTLENFGKTYYALLRKDYAAARESGIKIDWAKVGSDSAVAIILGKRKVSDFIYTVFMERITVDDENLKVLAEKITAAFI